MKTKKNIMLFTPISLVTIAIIVTLFTFGIPTDNNSQQAIEWLKGQQKTIGLLDSYENEPEDDVGYLYDQALAIISFCFNKQNHGYAKDIIKALDNPLVLQKEGAWYSGFSANDASVKEWNRPVGANAWMILAVLHYISTVEQNIDEIKHYIDLSISCADWIIEKQTVTSGQNEGAVKWGLEGATQNNGISTEVNCDAYAALKGLGKYLKNFTYGGQNLTDLALNYEEKADKIKNWVLNHAYIPMYKNNIPTGDYFFLCGITDTGGFDYSQISDAQTFPYLAFISYCPEEKPKLDQAIQWAIKTIESGGLIQENLLYSGTPYTGPCFGRYVSWNIDMANNKYPHIWWEAAGQLVEVLNIQGDTNNKNKYLNELINTQKNKGIPYSFASDDSEAPKKWPYNLPYNSVAATSWFYFACNLINPFVPTINYPPVLNQIGNKSVDEGKLLNFTITATDPDGNTLTYSATGLPTGATLDSKTGIFNWAPTHEQAGEYNVGFTVSDNLLIDQEIITITVNNVNRPPILNPIGNKAINENGTITFTISATDPDSDNLTYSASGLPNGANLNSTNKTFTWKTTGKDVGYYYITFTVTDNAQPPLSDSETIIIQVFNLAPPAPTGLKANIMLLKTIGGLYVKLEWNSVSDPNLTGYNVYRYYRSPNSSWQQLNRKSITVPEFIDTTSKKPGEYIYKINAKDKFGTLSKDSNYVKIAI